MQRKDESKEESRKHEINERTHLSLLDIFWTAGTAGTAVSSNHNKGASRTISSAFDFSLSLYTFNIMCTNN